MARRVIEIYPHVEIAVLRRRVVAATHEIRSLRAARGIALRVVTWGNSRREGTGRSGSGHGRHGAAQEHE
jgi:hypothetical protein